MKTNKTLAAILAALMVAAAVFLGLSGKPVSRDSSLYVTDPADVISPSATQELLSMAAGRSARLSIAAVQSTGKLSTADYTEALWKRWQMGSSDLLLVMVTGSAQDYYFGYDTGSDAGMVPTTSMAPCWMPIWSPTSPPETTAPRPSPLPRGSMPPWTAAAAA